MEEKRHNIGGSIAMSCLWRKKRENWFSPLRADNIERVFVCVMGAIANFQLDKWWTSEVDTNQHGLNNGATSIESANANDTHVGLWFSFANISLKKRS